eukprot:scaffold389_cov382-Prasinococcus_capsulatus_cf.AAC.14
MRPWPTEAFDVGTTDRATARTPVRVRQALKRTGWRRGGTRAVNDIENVEMKLVRPNVTLRVSNHGGTMAVTCPARTGLPKCNCGVPLVQRSRADVTATGGAWLGCDRTVSGQR